jgi:hypothetical protein
MILDSTASKFRRLGLSSTRLSSDALLPDQATNAWVVGPPPMMYPLCLPWVGWYTPWASPLMHFHPRWSEPTEGFGHGGYYIGDGHYGYVSHQQDRRASRQKNWTVQNAKLDHPVSPKIEAALGRWHNESGSSQGKTGPRSESSANDEAKPNVERSRSEVIAE